MIVFHTKTKRVRSFAWLSKRSMRQEKILTILRDLKRRYARKHLVLFWDGLPAHRANRVRRHITENNSWLTVHRFPAYAPELNPQEYLWSAVKRKDMGNYCPQKPVQLTGKVYRSLRKRQNSSAFLKGCLKASRLFSAKELGEGQ
jgi:transposase